MVVIAIIGILSAIAVPSYKTYVIKANYAEIITIMEATKSNIIQAYNTTGSMSSAIGAAVGSGITYPVANNDSIWNSSNILTFGAWVISNNNGHIYVHINTNSPLFPKGYNTNGSSFGQLNMQILDSKDIIVVTCFWDSRAAQLPVDYLPGGCNGAPQDPTKYLPKE